MTGTTRRKQSGQSVYMLENAFELRRRESPQNVVLSLAQEKGHGLLRWCTSLRRRPQVLRYKALHLRRSQPQAPRQDARDPSLPQEQAAVVLGDGHEAQGEEVQAPAAGACVDEGVGVLLERFGDLGVPEQRLL